MLILSWEDLTQTMKTKGFTIIELLIVIVVIGVLVAITAVTYTGVRQRAVAVSIESDLSVIDKQVRLYAAKNGTLPTSIFCPAVQPTEICVKPSGDNQIASYRAISNDQYIAVVKNGKLVYRSGAGAEGATTAELTAVEDGLQGYYDVNNPNSYSNGSSSWNDLSGNGRNATLTSITSTSGDGLKELVFDRSVSLLKIPTMPTQSIFMLVNIDSVQVGGAYYLLDSRPSNSGGYIYSSAGGNWENYRVNTLPIAKAQANIPRDQWVAFYAETNNLYNSDINIFSRYSLAERMAGKIRAILVYNRKLSAFEVAQNQDYFNFRNTN